ncbi:MAG TPA: hypothetical protein VIJ57_03060 [Hanamia sp.]
MNQSDLIAFLQENLQRLKTKSPKFFRVWNFINSVILLFSGIPTILNMINISSLDVILPNSATKIVLKIIAFSAAWGLFMNKLTVKSSHEVVEDSGVLIQKPCDSLPFTAKKEPAKLL